MRPVWSVVLGFNDYAPADWIPLVVIAPMIRAGLETLLVRRACSRKVGRKGYWLLCLANGVCIAVAIYALFVYVRAQGWPSYFHGVRAVETERLNPLRCDGRRNLRIFNRHHNPANDIRQDAGPHAQHRD